MPKKFNADTEIILYDWHYIPKHTTRRSQMCYFLFRQ